MERLPDNLWLGAAAESGSELIIMADGWFLLSYLIGLLVLMFYSFHRLFNEHSFDIDGQREKILQFLPPGNLRGTMTLMRAYLVYIVLLGALYTLISFAGAFIWRVIEMFKLGEVVGPVAGNANLQFDDPAWPLGVSLAFVGLLTHIPKVDLIERTIRRWAHESIGIPPLIKELTRNVIRAPLLPDPESASVNPRVADNQKARDLVAALDAEADADTFCKHLDRVAILQKLILEDNSPWPSARIVERFSPFGKVVADEVDDLFDDVEGAVHLLGDIPDSIEPDSDKSSGKLDQARRKCKDLLAKAAVAHGDLCALVAIYHENDPETPSDASPVLRRFLAKLDEAQREQDKSSDQLVNKLLLILLTISVGVFVATWTAMKLAWTPPVGAWGAAGTALYYALQMVVVFVPSAFVGLALQGHHERKRNWKPWQATNGLYPMRQYFGVAIWGYFAALLSIVFFYFVFFLTANDISLGQGLFVRFIPLYLWVALVGALQAALSGFAQAELRRENKDQGERAIFGVQIGVAVPVLHMLAAALLLGIIYESFSTLLAGGGRSGAATYWFTIIQSGVVAGGVTALSALGRRAETVEEVSLEGAG